MTNNLDELSKAALRQNGYLNDLLRKAKLATTAQEGELLAKELIERCNQVADAVIKLAKHHRRDAHEKSQPDLFSTKGTS